MDTAALRILQSLKLTSSVNHLATIMSPIVSTYHTHSRVFVSPSVNIYPDQGSKMCVERLEAVRTWKNAVTDYPKGK